jgi:hypothetical protein
MRLLVNAQNFARVVLVVATSTRMRPTGARGTAKVYATPINAAPRLAPKLESFWE